VNIEKTKFSIYGECYRLSNGTVELLITTDVGPRVISYKFVDGANILAELGPDVVVKSELGEWHPWGGHRLWHAPEVMPRSYVPDDFPVKAEAGTNSVRLMPDVEASTGIQKDITVTLDPEGTHVTLTHTLTNKGVWGVKLAPWCLTIVNGGGYTIVPQEPYISHDDYLLPSRAMAIWHFTDMSDPRWTWGKKFVFLQTDADRKSPQKLGVANKQGWAGYLREETLFVKRFPFVEGAEYPDCGVNFETYTDGGFMEVETLAPLVTLEPGESTTHVENWYLFKDAKAAKTEESIEQVVLPLVKQTEG
jgi:hypothetical protein